MRERKDGDTKDEKKFTEGEMEQEENKKNKEKKSGAAEDRTLAGGSVEDGESGEKKGGRDEVGDESKMAPATLQHHWTSILLPPSYPLLLSGTTSCYISALSAATTFTLHEDESAEGPQPPRRETGANHAAGDE